MRKILILLSLISISLCALELQWVNSYHEALLKAKKEKKNLMLLVTSETCRWCKKLENTTLIDKEVVQRLQKDYVVVQLTRDEDNYPKVLKVASVPATFFLDAKGKPIIKQVIGYWSAEDYLSYMDDVDFKLGKKKY